VVETYIFNLGVGGSGFELEENDVEDRHLVVRQVVAIGF
jgi:hypothetical protein